VTPPRADSDAIPVRPVAPPDADTGAYERTASRDAEVQPPSTASGHVDQGRTPNPERERMIARGPSTETAPGDPEDAAADKAAGLREPRIEQYRER
jgi:hypothetical protein